MKLPVINNFLSVCFSVLTPPLELRLSSLVQSRLKMVFCCSTTQRSLSSEERSITWWRNGNCKGCGSIFIKMAPVFLKVYISIWNSSYVGYHFKSALKATTTSLSLLFPGSCILIMISLYFSTFRVWPNTAGITSEQKADLLPLWHLVRWGKMIFISEHFLKHKLPRGSLT